MPEFTYEALAGTGQRTHGSMTANSEREVVSLLDAKGLFAQGNAIAKGNVGNARMKELRLALIDCVTPEKVREVEASLYETATGGDVAAAKVWLDHIVGKPVQAVELSGPDGQALGVEVVMTAVLSALAPFPEARLADIKRYSAAGKLSVAARPQDGGAGGRITRQRRSGTRGGRGGFLPGAAQS